ncbi:MAG: phage tail protein [Bacteroidota bacterium]
MQQPIQRFHFKVEWGGTHINFSRVEGLSMRTQVHSYRGGASPVYSPIKIPGRQSYSNIVLKRGMMASDNEFFDWFKSTMRLNSIEKRDLKISILNGEHEPIVDFKIRNAFPTALSFAELDAMADSLMIESLEIAHEGLVVDMG